MLALLTSDPARSLVDTVRERVRKHVPRYEQLEQGAKLARRLLVEVR